MERYRIVKDVAVYYSTFSVVEWLPVFIDETACRIIASSVNFCIRSPYKTNSTSPTAYIKGWAALQPSLPALRHIVKDNRQIPARF